DGWINYFELLTEYSNERVEQFARTFDGQQAMVDGISFPVIEDLIGKVTGLPQNGENWEEKPNAQQIRQQFFQGEKYNQTKGGIETRSLLEAWREIVTFIIKYFTCEEVREIDSSKEEDKNKQILPKIPQQVEIEEEKSEGKQEPEFQTLEQALKEINILRSIIRNLEGTRGLDALIGAEEALEKTPMEEEK
ncbi:hypothetical protein KI387_039443, partial [Taxus chinensis]